MLHVISVPCVACDLHTTVPGPLARTCWTVHDAVRRLQKILNCAFQIDYYYYYYYLLLLFIIIIKLRQDKTSMFSTDSPTGTDRYLCRLAVCGSRLGRRRTSHGTAASFCPASSSSPPAAGCCPESTPGSGPAPPPIITTITMQVVALNQRLVLGLQHHP